MSGLRNRWPVRVNVRVRDNADATDDHYVVDVPRSGPRTPVPCERCVRTGRPPAFAALLGAKACSRGCVPVHIPATVRRLVAESFTSLVSARMHANEHPNVLYTPLCYPNAQQEGHARGCCSRQSAERTFQHVPVASRVHAQPVDCVRLRQSRGNPKLTGQIRGGQTDSHVALSTSGARTRWRATATHVDAPNIINCCAHCAVQMYNSHSAAQPLGMQPRTHSAALSDRSCCCMYVQPFCTYACAMSSAPARYAWQGQRHLLHCRKHTP